HLHRGGPRVRCHVGSAPTPAVPSVKRLAGWRCGASTRSRPPTHPFLPTSTSTRWSLDPSPSPSMCCSTADSNRADRRSFCSRRAAAGERTATLEWRIPQVRKQVRHLLRQVSRLLFGGVFLKFECKDPGNEGGVTLTPPDDGFCLGGGARCEGGFTLGRGGP